jgi:hypothetical protein
MNRSKRLLVIGLALAGSAIGGAAVRAATIPVPNGDFEDWQAIGDGGVTNTGWASVPSGQTPATNVGRNDEMWTNPGNFGSGWQSNGPQPTNGKYGLQQPSNAHHVKEGAAEPFTLAAPFNGNFIGFMNLTEADGVGASAGSVQSGILGNLQQGEYALTVAFGNRRNTPWNDYSGTISLVVDPVLAAPAAGGLAHGSMGGTVLGTPATITMVPDPVPSGAGVDMTIMELTYVLTLGAGDPNIGKPYAIRIDVANLGVRDGTTTDLSTFTQANFDNVRLEFVPEPSALALTGLGVLAAALGRRRIS